MGMKFIESTDLVRWSGSKDCQQSLPELIRRLIDATLNRNSLNKFSFAIGDATYLPGWDGIVDCNENFDLIPSGISLWECGTTEDVSAKINSDYKKRDNDPLGYDKSKSTFVFVTTRRWTGTDEWLQTHGTGWKKVVVYTAVELERWIDNTPSVGIWLANKLNKLSAGGYMPPELYWQKWSTGKQYELPYDIILHGRENISKQIIETCNTNQYVILQTLTQEEGIVFAIASIFTCKDAEFLKQRVIVVKDINAYNDLVEHYENLILITTITDNINYTTKRGHAVIVASTPADMKKGAVTLPRIEKEGFVNSLVKIGFDEEGARKIARDTARDINVFRRRENFGDDKPKWTEYVKDLLPAILVGKWYEDCNGDKEILEELSGKKYEEYDELLHMYSTKEEFPLIHIGKMWRLQSPYEAIEYTIYSHILTDSILDKYRAICLKLIEDDDPNAINKIEAQEFVFYKFEQKYSDTIKKGVFQNLCLLSIESDSKDVNLCEWVDTTIAKMLTNWNLQRFLSSQQFLPSLAEASPKVFLSFVDGLPKDILDLILTPRQNSIGLGEKIYYVDLLWCLEMLAWEEEYFFQVICQLLRFSEYTNDSNVGDKPIISLNQIFQLLLPQTFVPFEGRIQTLHAHSTKCKSVIYKLCVRMCESLEQKAFFPNQYYKWRLYGELKSKNNIKPITVQQLESVTTLMLKCCDYSIESIIELLKLSSNANMDCVRNIIIDAIRRHLNEIKCNMTVVDELRADIILHKRCQDARWALSEDKLKIYEDLLSDILPEDVMLKNAWLFDDNAVQLPKKRITDYETDLQEQKIERDKALKDVIAEKGTDGLWSFIKIVKCPESLCESIVSIYDDALNSDIIQKFKNQELSESFINSYFTVLYRKDVSKYLTWAKQLVSSDKSMSMILYAPTYVKELADIAKECGDEVNNSYWESVIVWSFGKEDINRVIGELTNVNRYSDVINIIYANIKDITLSEEDIVKILYEYIKYNSDHQGGFDMLHISSILEKLDNSNNPNIIGDLVNIELQLFGLLEYNVNPSKLRIIKELSHKPLLMVKLVELAYIPDDFQADMSEKTIDEAKKQISKNAHNILTSGLHITAFINEQGEYDFECMKCYIDELRRLAEERKRTKAIYSVIGTILGDIPRDNNYPPEALCEIVEYLDNDVVDSFIETQIYNSRGATFRKYNEGGEQEHNIVSKLKSFKDKTKFLSPRMTKIFDRLIHIYTKEAGRLDDEAAIMDLEY